MKFHKQSLCDDNTKRIITAVEQAVKEHIPTNKIQSVIMLRHFSYIPVIRDFVKAHNSASYNSTTDTNPDVIGLSDAKQWMEAIERGESVLDGIS